MNGATEPRGVGLGLNCEKLGSREMNTGLIEFGHQCDMLSKTITEDRSNLIGLPSSVRMALIRSSKVSVVFARMCQ
jgi:hypothetical protein